MGRAKTPDEIQADIDRAEAKVSQLKARKQAALQRQAAADRKKRNHSLIVLGAWVEAACGGDWRAIDAEALDRMLTRYGKAYRRLATMEGRSAADADAAFRAVDARRRSAKRAKEDEEAAAQAVAAPQPGGFVPPEGGPSAEQIEAIRQRIKAQARADDESEE